MTSTCAGRLDRYELSPEERERVSRRLGLIRETVQDRPKSLGWKIRSRIGRRVRWHRDVEGQG